MVISNIFISFLLSFWMPLKWKPFFPVEINLIWVMIGESLSQNKGEKRVYFQIKINPNIRKHGEQWWKSRRGVRGVTSQNLPQGGLVRGISRFGPFSLPWRQVVASPLLRISWKESIFLFACLFVVVVALPNQVQISNVIWPLPLVSFSTMRRNLPYVVSLYPFWGDILHCFLCQGVCL